MELFKGRIEVGGKLPAGKLDDFIDALIQDGLYDLDDSREPLDYLKDLIKRSNRKHLIFEEEGASLGRFHYLESFCEEHNLTYVRESAVFENYDGIRVWHHPDNTGKNFHLLDVQGRPHLSKEEVSEILNATKKIGRVEDAPEYISDNTKTGEYAKYVMRKGEIDPLGFIEQQIEVICPEVPEVPPFELTTVKILAIYDNEGKTLDRYSVYYDEECSPGTLKCLSMSEDPFHPMGVCQHSSGQLGDHNGKKIDFNQLPDDCREAVNEDLSVD